MDWLLYRNKHTQVYYWIFKKDLDGAKYRIMLPVDNHRNMLFGYDSEIEDHCVLVTDPVILAFFKIPTPNRI